MKCALCDQRIFHLRGIKLNLCTACLLDTEPVLYSKHLITHSHYTFKLNVYYAYTKSIKALVSRFKFSKELELCTAITSIFMENMDLKSHPDLIVPVPSHPVDEIKRGYSHMSIVARHLSKNTEVRTLNVLKRRFFPLLRRSQKLKDRAHRLEGAKRFCLRVNASEISAKRVLLIDDVTTTGATVSECAELLLQHGAKSVEVVCFALTRL